MKIVRIAPLPERDQINRIQQRYRLGIYRFVKRLAIPKRADITFRKEYGLWAKTTSFIRRAMAYARQKVCRHDH